MTNPIKQNATAASATNSGDKPENGKTHIEIFTDGACFGNPGPGGWGFVALLKDETGKIIAQKERCGAARAITTNNRAELAGPINALILIKHLQESDQWPACTVTLNSDSQYVVKGITEWVPAWEARGWLKRNGKTPDNRDLWERLEQAADGLTIVWQWVRGHSGNRWNERADELATAGAKQAQTLGVSFRKPSE